MTRIRMRDTTAHPVYGSMLRGEVYEVAEEDASHLVGVGRLAREVHGNTRTRAERLAEEQGQRMDEAENEDQGNFNPQIEEQVRHAGLREGDQSAGAYGSPHPLNAPPTREYARDETQHRVLGSPPAADEDEAPARPAEPAPSEQTSPRRGPGRPPANAR